jgi:ribosome-associated translation inhibitor RaiA
MPFGVPRNRSPKAHVRFSEDEERVPLSNEKSAAPGITADGLLQIVFHNMRPSAALAADIRKRVAKLEKLFGRLIGCRVSVEALHRQHRKGNVYEVHIEIDAPGRRIVVSHEPHRVSERHRKPTARNAIHDAFKTAEEQLKEFKAQRNKARPEPPLYPDVSR